MDWILFIFKRGNHFYLVPSGSEENAWIDLAQRQSISIERCKKEYKYITFMNEMSEIIKL